MTHSRESSVNPILVIVLPALVVLVICIFGALVSERGSFASVYGETLVWETYTGTVSVDGVQYGVSISDETHQKGRILIVHLKPGGGAFKSISGHGNGDENWSRIFYCGDWSPLANSSAALGCNASLRTATGWKFEPCNGDEGRVTPFSNKAIDFASTTLNKAVREVLNEGHLEERWLRKGKALVRVTPEATL